MENSYANALIAQWRNNASIANPAGPLFVSGEYAEADITSETSCTSVNTKFRCSVCTASANAKYCC